MSIIKLMAVEIDGFALSNSSGSKSKVTGVNGTPRCKYETRIDVDDYDLGKIVPGYICMASLDTSKGIYLPCQSTPKGCPVGQFQPQRKGTELVVVKNQR